MTIKPFKEWLSERYDLFAPGSGNFMGDMKLLADAFIEYVDEVVPQMTLKVDEKPTNLGPEFLPPWQGLDQSCGWGNTGICVRGSSKECVYPSCTTSDRRRRD